MTVQAQHDTSGSMLSLYRDALRLRRTLPDLHDPSFAWRGSPADVLIFDLAKVNDAATYQEPHQLAEGMTEILVNRRWARRNGQFTTTLAGRVVAPDRR